MDDTRSVSRKFEDENVREKLRQLAGKLDLPDGSGVIVRTNGLDQTKLTLSRDLAALLRLWKRVQTEARRGQGTRLLYSDQDLIVQTLRDHLDASIEEVLVDDDDAFERAAAYLQASMPRGRSSSCATPTGCRCSASSRSSPSSKHGPANWRVKKSLAPPSHCLQEGGSDIDAVSLLWFVAVPTSFLPPNPPPRRGKGPG